MYVSLQELLKEPSISNKAIRCLRIQPETKIPKPVPKITKDPPVMIQNVMNKGDGYPPFYVSLEINHLILHNCMLDSGAEVNVMPYKVMNQLELTTTRQFGNVCGMDSRPVESKGVIENLKMKLAAYLDVEITMNVLVIDIADVWGMLLSREWATKLGGNIQLDLTYPTIPISKTTSIKLMNEPPMIEHVETPDHLFDDAMCATNVGNFMVLANFWEEARPHPFPPSNIWKMHFDDANSSHGAGAGIVLISLAREETIHSFRLEFDCNNNVAEYEALLLGLGIARDMKIKVIQTY